MKKGKAKGGQATMLTKFKRFISNPVYLLAVIVSIAIIGTGAYFSVKALADASPASSSFIDENFTKDVINFVSVGYDNQYMQVVCKDLTDYQTYSYDMNFYGSCVENDDYYFYLSYYDNYDITLETAIPDKTFDVYQSATSNGEKTKVASFSTGNLTELKKIYIGGSSNYFEGSNSFIQAVITAGKLNVVDGQTYNQDDFHWIYNPENDEYINPTGSYESFLTDILGMNLDGVPCSFCYREPGKLYTYGNVYQKDGYIKDLPVVIPKNDNVESYIYVSYDSDTILDDPDETFEIEISDLCGTFGLPEAANGSRTVMYSEGGSGWTYLPIEVLVNYSIGDHEGLLIKPNDFAGTDSQILYASTMGSHELKNSDGYLYYGETKNFQYPQYYNGDKTDADKVNDDEWIDTDSWIQQKGTKTSFPYGEYITIEDLLTEGSFDIIEKDGYICFSLPLQVKLPEVITYKLSYSVSGDIPNGYIKPEDKKFKADKVVTVEDVPDIDGYTFKGWSLPDGHGIAAENMTLDENGYVTSFNMPEKDIELKGVFEEKAYTIIYDDNSDAYNVVIDDFYNEMKNITGIPEKVEIKASKIGNGYSLAASGPDSYNYKFVGWGLTADRTTDDLIKTVTFDDFGDQDTLTVYAKWQAKMLITYSSGLRNDGNQTTEFVVDVYDVNGYIIKANNELNPPFKNDGFEIKTWKVTEGSDLIEVITPASSGDSAGTNVKTNHAPVNWLNPGDKVRFHGNITMSAEWTPVATPDPDPEYTVTYDPNGGTGTAPTDSNKYKGGETVKVADKGDLAKDGSTFKEWNTASDGSGTGYKGDGTATFEMPESNVTLYAIWAANAVSSPDLPGTGESVLPIVLASCISILGLLTAGFVLFTQQKRRRQSAD